MKKFRNYNFEFDKNERKILSSFSKQVIKQMETDNRFFADVKAFGSILSKLNEPSDVVKLTKDEYTRLGHQLRENVKFLQTKAEKGWFFKKWLYKSIYLQYKNLITTHFSD